ncbi:PREDICTED: inositol 1,4,5-trisphosphate receptor-interacting protein-like 1 [Mesitornis unicolor]|uniref:inositol 1,4,5-trisphosphate receptor-interacting protein-like 1 n=1 Tax=Mesitornis unicolor TaxID=54374 RepID=UPI00052820E2|nr:PREDICTED: inositol 1,4,5-trisphosphate receptor-interacting protein-like 1 [Mesitornis unicolor]
MAVAITFILAVLAVEHALKGDPQIDVATAHRMQEREDHLCQEMTRLLQEVEQIEQKGKLLSVLKLWELWATIGAAVLVPPFLMVRDIWLDLDSGSEQDSSSSDEADDDEEEDLNSAYSGVRSLAASTPSSMEGLPDMCKVLKEVVGDLLAVCRVLSKKDFMPQMHPALGMDSTYEDWRVHENSITYRLLVLLQPPPGHSFSAELESTGQLPARTSSIRVVLECMCSREQLLGARFCLLHHPNDKVPTDQRSYLLSTLCTSSDLDRKKIACWVQYLVGSAWPILPQSHHCQLTVLPSSRSCRFQLTSTSLMNIFTEMIFAVQQDSSDSYLNLE